MTQVSFTRKRNPSHKLSAETVRFLGERAADDPQSDAVSDPDNPPVSEERLSRMVIAREVRRIREKAQLSQLQFATTYRIGVGRLRDWEQGRTSPDLPLLVFLHMIDDDPAAAARMVAEVESAYLAA